MAEIRKLNTLRGIAAMIVFVTHFSDATDWLDGVLGGAAGQYGVMLFFLLSGFLMAHLYWSRPANKDNIKQYLLARVGRIVPLYLLVVLASFVLSFWQLDWLYSVPDGQALVAHLLFIYGDSVLWSISPEVQFYLLFVLLWPWAGQRMGYITVFVAAVLLLLFFTNFPRIVGDIDGVKYNFFHVLRSLPYFFVGMLLGAVYRTWVVPPYLKKHIFVLALLLIPLLYPAFSPVLGAAKTRMWLHYEVLLVMSAVFFAVVFLVPDNNPLLANPIGDFVGKLSYSLYLLHMPVIAQVNQLEWSVTLKLVVSLSLSLGLAYLSYRFFEKPCASWIRGWSHGKKQAT